MPFIVATYVYASSQGQRTHSARTKISCILPSPTLSEVASLFSQNPTQLRTTMRVQGKYTWPEDGDGVVGKYSRHYYLDNEVPSVPL